MINYILQVILFQVLFLVIYDFFLSKETFFRKNRWYLVSTPILSFLIPFIKISSLQKAVSEEFVIQLPEIVLNPDKVIHETITQSNLNESANYMTVLFWVGVALFSVLFLIKLFKIISLIQNNKRIRKVDFTLILIPKQTKAFSFFNYIFLGSGIKETNREKIIQHELVHSKQKHSLDLLLFEFLKIAMWFNPMIYFYQKRITLVHEYISDAVVSKSESKETYINNLLSNFFQIENISFVNQFYKPTLIKKRIIMMSKTQSKKMNQLKYLVLIPVLASMLFYTSCASLSKVKETTENEKESIVKINKEVKTVDEISITEIDKAPTFPGCESGDKDCFSKKFQMHFAKNFNSSIPKNLGLEPGKKRVLIDFKIDKNGNVKDINTTAPHIKIEEEVIRVINTLPKVIPGEQEGKTVAVKYSVPFTLFVAD